MGRSCPACSATIDTRSEIGLPGLLNIPPPQNRTIASDRGQVEGQGARRQGGHEVRVEPDVTIPPPKPEAVFFVTWVAFKVSTPLGRS